MTFWTFGVDHYELEESTVQYEKKMQKSQILEYTRLDIWDISRGTWEDVRKFDKFGHKVRNMDANKLKITSIRW